MKKINFLPLIFFFALLFAQCAGTCVGDKTAFITNFNQFVSEKLDKSNNESRHRLFRQYVKDCYPLHESKMSVVDKKDFWVGVLRYYYQHYGLGLINAMKNEGDMKEVLDRGLEEVSLNLEDINIADIIRLL